eukprot:164593-Alexandrium_andersonii.AAC.1
MQWPSGPSCPSNPMDLSWDACDVPTSWCPPPAPAPPKKTGAARWGVGQLHVLCWGVVGIRGDCSVVANRCEFAGQGQQAHTEFRP